MSSVKAVVCTLFSGSSGNCTYISAGGNEFLIDAGVSTRSIKNALSDIGTDISRISAVFLTHEHDDHIKGLEGICSKYNTAVIGNNATLNMLPEKMDKHSHLFFEMQTGSAMQSKGVRVTSFATSHDSVESVGYKIVLGDGTCIGYTTDLGYMSKSVLDMLRGCQYVVIEANHDVHMLKSGTYPEFLKRRILSKTGHLSNEACAETVVELMCCGTENVVLAHLSEENNDPEMAFNTIKKRLFAENTDRADNMTLQIAPKASTLRICIV